MKKIEKEIRKVLDHVVRQGAYSIGEIKIIESLARSQKVELQEELKILLNINECDHC